jgi:hypothetical protein
MNVQRSVTNKVERPKVSKRLQELEHPKRICGV